MALLRSFLSPLSPLFLLLLLLLLPSTTTTITTNSPYTNNNSTAISNTATISNIATITTNHQHQVRGGDDIRDEVYVTVTATPDGSDKIKVNWTLDNSVPTQVEAYFVSWTDGDSNDFTYITDTNTTSHTIRNLVPCTSLTVTVQPFDGDNGGNSVGGHSEDSTTTDAEGPASPIKVDVTKVEYTSDSLSVTWTQAQPAGRCNVTSNIVSWRRYNSNDTVHSTELSHPTEAYTITSLEPWTTYIVCVKAAHLSLEGIMTCDTSTTDEDIPGPPESTAVEVLSSTSILVTWEAPSSPNGIITTYRVNWTSEFGENGEGEAEDPEVTTYTASGLEACTTYNFIVTASTRIGEGPESDGASDTTEQGAPDSVESLNVTKLIHDFGLNVTWHPPPGNCNLTYTVSWSLENGTHNGESVTLDLGYEIMDLDKNTTYKVCVTASVDEEITEPVCANETTIMSRLWLNLESSPTTIDASWFLVLEADSYLLTWNDGSGGKFKLVEGNVSQYTIDKLEPCNNYEVSLAALMENVKLDSDADSLSTLPQEPSPVTSLNITQVGYEPELTVTWPPVTSPGKCHLTYTVNWTWNANDTIESDQYDTTNSKYLITNLNYNTEYSVCVESWVQDLHTTPACGTETVIEQRLDMILEPTSTSISVSWSLVDHADSYYMEWTDQHTRNWATVDGTTDNYVITSLDPCGNYTITLDAQNGSSKLKSESNVTQTLPQAATPVSDLSLTQMIREPGLGVTWSSVPTPGYCNLNYKINWSHLDNTEDGQDTTTDLQYNITNLEHGTEYTVCVISSVEGEDAEEVCQTGTTTNSKIGLYLESTSTTIHAYWNTIEGADSYYLSWTNTNDGAWTTVHDTDNFLINDVLPSSNYTVVIEARSGEDVLEQDMRSILTLPEVSSPAATDRDSGRRDPEKSSGKTKAPQPKTSQKQRLPPLALARFGPLH